MGLEVTLIGSKPVGEHPGKAVNLIPPEFINRHFVEEKHEHIDLIYFATSVTDNVIPEHGNDEWAWLSKDELEDPKYSLSETMKLYAKTALTKVNKKS